MQLIRLNTCAYKYNSDKVLSKNNSLIHQSMISSEDDATELKIQTHQKKSASPIQR